MAVCLTVNTVCAQEQKQEPGSTKENEPFSPHHKLGIVLAHAHVFEGRDELGNRQSLALPAFSLDYDYFFRPKWAVGIHTDFILESFKVEKHLDPAGSAEIIERSYPIAPALMGIYKPNRHWGFMIGAGVEFASEGNLFLNRLAVEYAAEIRNGWEVSGTLSYDIKWNEYDTWVLGIGISKQFGGGHKK